MFSQLTDLYIMSAQRHTHIHKDHEDSQRKAESAGTTCVRAQAKNNYLTKYCVERET